MDKYENSRPLNDEDAIGELNHIVKSYRVAKCRQFAIEKAKVALAKQIPREPRHLYFSIDSRQYGECPNCGHTGLLKDVHKHCWWCGQALKWGGNK